MKLIKPGQILFTIYSKNQTNEPRRHITASVGIAQPKDKSRYGYLSEYDSFGQSQKEAGDYAEDIAVQMLASSLGIPFDIDKSSMRKTICPGFINFKPAVRDMSFAPAIGIIANRPIRICWR